MAGCPDHMKMACRATVRNVAGSRTGHAWGLRLYGQFGDSGEAYSERQRVIESIFLLDLRLPGSGQGVV